MSEDIPTAGKPPRGGREDRRKAQSGGVNPLRTPVIVAVHDMLEMEGRVWSVTGVFPGVLFETPGFFRISLTANEDMIERSLHLSISLYGDLFICYRPIAFTMLVLLAATTAWPFIRNWRRRRAHPATEIPT